MSKCKPATKTELAWCKRLAKILAAHPKGLWLFAESDSLHVMKCPSDGEKMLKNGGVNGENSIFSIGQWVMETGGGGW